MCKDGFCDVYIEYLLQVFVVCVMYMIMYVNLLFGLC